MKGYVGMWNSSQRRPNDPPPVTTNPVLTLSDLDRITLDPAVMGGKPCIRGLRVTVGTVTGLLAAGKTREEILALYPCLDAKDFAQVIAYAAWRAGEREAAVSAW
jgi:uncharacterized protein (DUF433 family)